MGGPFCKGRRHATLPGCQMQRGWVPQLSHCSPMLLSSAALPPRSARSPLHPAACMAWHGSHEQRQGALRSIARLLLRVAGNALDLLEHFLQVE